MRHVRSACLSALIGFSFMGCNAQAIRPAAPMSPLNSFNARGVQAQSSASAKMRIATYNIRNLFDGVQTPGQQAIGAEAEQAKPEKELQALSQAMHDINADVLALQEVESKSTLTQFRDRFLADMGYREVILLEGNDERGIDVALMSRFPATVVKSHKDVRFNVPNEGQQGFSRDLLQVRLQAPNGYALTIFVVHLKSQHGGAQADLRRRAEAEAAHRIIKAFQAANPRENVLVMGDFNDQYNTAEIAPLVSPQSGLGLYDIIHEEMGAGPNVFTYHPQQYRSRIDFIMMNDNLKREYISKSVTLHKPFKQGNDWQKLYFYNASDHIPVTLDLDLSQDR